MRGLLSFNGQEERDRDTERTYSAYPGRERERAEISRLRGERGREFVPGLCGRVGCVSCPIRSRSRSRLWLEAGVRDHRRFVGHRGRGRRRPKRRYGPASPCFSGRQGLQLRALPHPPRPPRRHHVHGSETAPTHPILSASSLVPFLLKSSFIVRWCQSSLSLDMISFSELFPIWIISPTTRGAYGRR